MGSTANDCMSSFSRGGMVHIQLDELVTRVRRWAKRAWVWTAQDAQSKAWLAWHVGGRTQADAHRIVHRVTRVLAMRLCAGVHQ